MVTARDPDDLASARVARHLPRFRSEPLPAPPDWSGWHGILADRSGPRAAQINVVPRMGFGTVCASLLAIDDAGRIAWQFAPGPPGSHAIRAGGAGLMTARQSSRGQVMRRGAWRRERSLAISGGSAAPLGRPEPEAALHCAARPHPPGGGLQPIRRLKRKSPMARRRQLYEGKAKILFEGPEPGTLVQYFKDDATAFNSQKKGTITGKGVLNNRISEYLMMRLQEIGIPTHFVRRLNMREQLIREVEIMPLEVVVRNVAAGSLSTRLGIPEGTRLPRSIIEFYYKNDALQDPMVAEEHITAFGWATPQDMDDIVSLTLRVNDFLTGLFLGVGITLVDFKVEYGRLWENEDMRIILADEISPDNCRLWDAKTNEKMDKDRFRRDLGKVEEAYQEVAKRLGILPEAGMRDLKGPETMQ